MNGLRQIVAIGVLAIGATVTPAEAADRFWALFFDGSQVTATAFQNRGWWSDEAMLGGRRLFVTTNPVRMLENTLQGGALKGAHLLLANGDVLPGRVVQFLPPSSDGGLPARLLVSPAPPLVAANPRGLAIRADRVLRVVAAEKEMAASQPGTILLANGDKVIATAVRWTAEGAKLLTERVVVAVPFRDIVDLHIPRVDVMGAVLDDAFYPPLGPGAVVGRLTTIAGGVLTYHREMTLLAASRMAPISDGGSHEATHLCLHPSWSLDAILVPMDSVWLQSFRAAGEVPLSLLPATLVKQKSFSTSGPGDGTRTWRASRCRAVPSRWTWEWELIPTC